MLGDVGIDEQEQETSIEELGDEDTIGDGSEALTVSILLDTLNQLNDDGLESNIDSDDDEGDGSAETL